MYHVCIRDCSGFLLACHSRLSLTLVRFFDSTTEQWCRSPASTPRGGRSSPGGDLQLLVPALQLFYPARLLPLHFIFG